MAWGHVTRCGVRYDQVDTGAGAMPMAPVFGRLQFNCVICTMSCVSSASSEISFRAQDVPRVKHDPTLVP